MKHNLTTNGLRLRHVVVLGLLYLVQVGNVFALTIEPLPEKVGTASSEEVMLGKALFHDKRLSSDNSISCASCHDVSNGGDDGLPVSVGIGGVKGKLNAPSVYNTRFHFAQFWDGRASSLAEQVSGPVHNPIEMNSSWPQVVEKLKKDKQLAARFRRVYGEGVTAENITRAIVSYENNLVTLDSAFDRYLRGDESAINAQERAGYDLFKAYGCISCHQGKAVGGNMYQVFGVTKNYFAEKEYVRKADLGRFNVTGNLSDKYRFKVPSLRNIDQTAPYLHDGSVETLEEMVRIMAEYQLGRPIEGDHVDAIVAFLKTLTGRIDEGLK